MDKIGSSLNDYTLLIKYMIEINFLDRDQSVSSDVWKELSLKMDITIDNLYGLWEKDGDLIKDLILNQLKQSKDCDTEKVENDKSKEEENYHMEQKCSENQFSKTSPEIFSSSLLGQVKSPIINKSISSNNWLDIQKGSLDRTASDFKPRRSYLKKSYDSSSIIKGKRTKKTSRNSEYIYYNPQRKSIPHDKKEQMNCTRMIQVDITANSDKDEDIIYLSKNSKKESDVITRGKRKLLLPDGTTYTAPPGYQLISLSGLEFVEIPSEKELVHTSDGILIRDKTPEA